MKNIFIEYPKCSTCKKAKKWLEENKIEFVERNIVEETPTELNIKEKLSTMSDEEKIKLLASNGMLIKRPLLISDKGIFIGFKEEIWKVLCH